MEVVHRRCKEPKFSAKGGKDDVISSMPDNVIANIMDRLPLKDAVGTSILSPSWRFKWTLLTELIFDCKFFISLSRKVRFNKTDISRLLLHLKQVTKFYLNISSNFILDDEDIYHWIMFLSRIRGFKELILLNCHPTPLKLPTHLFCCQDLKHLSLCQCVFTFVCGFPKLLTLDLYKVNVRDHKYGELIVECPLLETVKIWDNNLRGGVKLVEIAKLLENVKILDLSLCLFDINVTMVRISTVFQHIYLLPKLQELCLTFDNCKFLPEDVAQNSVSTNFPFLKTLTLCEMDFSSVSMLSCTFGMIFRCTNLHTLCISAIYKNDIPLPAIFPPEVSNTMRQLHLQNVMLILIKGLENEVCLIKYILDCSPMLKSIKIMLHPSVKSNDKQKVASKLLKLHRASPVAEVIF